MLKGMKGYQLIPSDLEFIKKMQQEKLLKKLQVMVCLFFSLAAASWWQKSSSATSWGRLLCSRSLRCPCCRHQSDLEEVQKSLKKEMMAAELVYASREKAQAELKKVGLFFLILRVRLVRKLSLRSSDTDA